MTAPFRKPSENSHVAGAIEALRRAQGCFEALEQSVKEDSRGQALEVAATVLSLATNSPINPEAAEHASLELNHKTFWTSISEAKTLLAKAGFDVGPNEKTIWGNKHDAEAAQRDLQRLQALLPGTDFTPPSNDDVEAYLRSQRSSSVWKYVLIFLLFLVLPVGALILAGLYG